MERFELTTQGSSAAAGPCWCYRGSSRSGSGTWAGRKGWEGKGCIAKTNHKGSCIRAHTHGTGAHVPGCIKVKLLLFEMIGDAQRTGEAASFHDNGFLCQDAMFWGPWITPYLQT
eukprot:1162153-Pelagomonas_calceolata.AAC.8